MKLKDSMNAPHTRTVLLATLFVVTSLVAYKASANYFEAPHEHERDHAVVHFEDHEIVIDHNIEAEVQRKLEETRIRLQELGRELKAEFKHNPPDVHFRVERERARAFAHRMTDRGQMMIEETFDVREGGLLKVNVPGADVHVATTSGAKASVVVYLSGRDMDDAREYFEELDFEVYQSGNSIMVEAESRHSRRWGWRNRGGARIFVEAEVPVDFNAEVSTSGGDISLTEMNGHVELTTSGGDIELTRVNGPSARLRTSGGDIEVERVESREIALNTSGGDITGTQLTAQRIDIRTSGGDIEMDHMRGTAQVRTSGGRIQVGQMDGELEAVTSGGQINVSMERSSDLNLRTSGGSIVINAPGDLHADIELSGGRVRLDDTFSFRGSMKKQHAEGEINGGGPTIRASTSGGSVTLKRQ